VVVGVVVCVVVGVVSGMTLITTERASRTHLLSTAPSIAFACMRTVQRSRYLNSKRSVVVIVPSVTLIVKGKLPFGSEFVF
jgi:hypothetical protein